MAAKNIINEIPNIHCDENIASYTGYIKCPHCGGNLIKYTSCDSVGSIETKRESINCDNCHASADITVYPDLRFDITVSRN